MNREIKFRMWNRVGGNIQKSRMFYDTSQVMECLKQQVLFNNKSKLGYNHIADGNVFMQYTGIKDKNGKEIYEGDIATIKQAERMYVVKFNKGCFKLFHASPNLNDMMWGTIERVEELFWDIEIIGNIFENPELLQP